MTRRDTTPADMTRHDRRFHFTLHILFALLLLLFAPLAAAQNAPTLPAWEQLTPAQREQLIGPLRERWNSQPQTRQRMLRNAQRWQQLDPQQRQRAQRGLQRLRQMSPEQRQRAREMYQRMQALPDDQRKQLRQHLRQMSPEQRRQWLRDNKP